MDKIQYATKEFIRKDIPEFGSGDTLSIDVRVREGSKERIQKFESEMTLIPPILQTILII